MVGLHSPAKRNGLEPLRWLSDTPERLPTCANSKIDSLHRLHSVFIANQCQCDFYFRQFRWILGNFPLFSKVIERDLRNFLLESISMK